MNSPILFEAFEDGVLVPVKRFQKAATERYLAGQTYFIETREERSQASHGHYFARIHDLWMSMPDALTNEFPTEGALRKHALIMTGFRRERKFAMASREEARKLAVWLRDGQSDYAIISVKENVVVEWRPLSQSHKGMPTKGQFQESKTKTLAWIEDLIGVESEAA